MSKNVSNGSGGGSLGAWRAGARRNGLGCGGRGAENSPPKAPFSATGKMHMVPCELRRPA
jgi:hypothetical protein